jgi:N utilization substance protein A
MTTVCSIGTTAGGDVVAIGMESRNNELRFEQNVDGVFVKCLAARLTGWRIDIKSESTFATEEASDEFGDELEGGVARCAFILQTGRRCPNAVEAGSRYCALEGHTAEASAANQASLEAAADAPEAAEETTIEALEADSEGFVEAQTVVEAADAVEDAEATAEAIDADAAPEEAAAEAVLEEAAAEAVDAAEVSEEASDA